MVGAQPPGFLAAAALAMAKLLRPSCSMDHPPPRRCMGMVGGIAGLVTLALGNSAKTAALARQAGERLSLTTILSIATLIFIVALTILFSKIGRAGLDHAASVLGAEDRPISNAWIAMGASIALVGVSVVASYWINVNRFSLTRRQPLESAPSSGRRGRAGGKRGRATATRSVYRYRSGRQSYATEVDLAAGRAGRRAMPVPRRQHRPQRRRLEEPRLAGAQG